MARVTKAVGKLAETPYRIEGIEKNVYSAEELSYLITQNAQILDTGIMDPVLVSWLRECCDLPKLADRLEPLLGKERELSQFVQEILSYVGFVSSRSREKTGKIVASGQGELTFEKRLNRASYLAEIGEPYRALEEYEKILQDLPETESRVRTKALRGEGEVYAGLFRYMAAAECFEKAYDLEEDSDIYLEYLASLRMGLPESEYLDYISEHPEAGNASLQIEKIVERSEENYHSSAMAQSIAELKKYKERCMDTSYEIALHETVQTIKDDYVRNRQEQDGE